MNNELRKGYLNIKIIKENKSNVFESIRTAIILKENLNLEKLEITKSKIFKEGEIDKLSKFVFKICYWIARHGLNENDIFIHGNTKYFEKIEKFLKKDPVTFITLKKQEYEFEIELIREIYMIS
ncbi:hypothetical protein KAU33_01735 [Candidatus Dependentiae bacterium]|nr:hypothetical protein [Candidatus Dependentiae bacterium]